MNKSPAFVNLIDLACSKVGGKVMFATGWLAVTGDLLEAESPSWQEGVFPSSVGSNEKSGHDWCIIKLGIPGIIKGLAMDTAYFTDGGALNASVQAACLEEGEDASFKCGIELTEDKLLEKTEGWREIIPLSTLRPSQPSTRHNYFHVRCPERWTHIRLNLFPDGVIARLKVYGHAAKSCSEKSLYNTIVDLAAMENGGQVVACSDKHYSHPCHLILPSRALNMADGWRTARRLDRPSILTVSEEDGLVHFPGFEWTVIRLAQSGVIQKFEVDTNHFKGNYPDSCTIEGCVMSANDEKMLKLSPVSCQVPWKTLLTARKLKPHKRHFFCHLLSYEVVTHVRFIICPDGGVSRLRCWGIPTQPTLHKL